MVLFRPGKLFEGLDFNGQRLLEVLLEAFQRHFYDRLVLFIRVVNARAVLYP